MSNAARSMSNAARSSAQRPRIDPAPVMVRTKHAAAPMTSDPQPAGEPMASVAGGVWRGGLARLPCRPNCP
jgi:hypothetical protein